MEKNLVMRWSDGFSFAVPFIVDNKQTIRDNLIVFQQSSTCNAELHVFIPSGRRGAWATPRHGSHVIVRGLKTNMQVNPHKQYVRPDGLVFEEITLFSDDDLDEIIAMAHKTMMTWGTSDENRQFFPPECVVYALQDSLALLRSDLVYNIRWAANNNLIPAPSDENNPKKLYTLARKYRLLDDFRLAYPEFVSNA